MAAATLKELAEQIFEKVREHERSCQCRTCFQVERTLFCVECPDCSAILIDRICDLLRTVNKR